MGLPGYLQATANPVECRRVLTPAVRAGFKPRVKRTYGAQSVLNSSVHAACLRATSARVSGAGLEGIVKEAIEGEGKCPWSLTATGTSL